MRNINQKGFSAIEGLLILIIVGIVGGLGWYVWKANEDSKRNLNSASQAETMGINLKGKVSMAGWKAYEGPDFKLQHPGDWSFSELVKNQCPLAAEQYKTTNCPIQFGLAPGNFTKEQVERDSPIRGIVYTDAKVALDEVFMLYKSQYQKVAKAQKFTVNGLKGFVVKQDANDTAPNGYIRSYYVIQLSGEKYLDMSFDHIHGSADYGEYEGIASTIISSIERVR
jgi:hypothetical protein